MLTGGGTAGHVYPALAVAEDLAGRRTGPSPELLYVGSTAGLERDLVGRSGLKFAGLNISGGVRGMGLAAVPNAVALIKGIIAAFRVVRAFGPKAILATGGYVCGPVVVAGWLLRVPSLVYLPDIEPGWAIRFLAPFARRVAVTVPESEHFFRPGKATVTGYPLRSGLTTAHRDEARAFFGFADTDRVLLVAGGSRGAQRINEAVRDGLIPLLNEAKIIHVCGPSHFQEMNAEQETLPPADRSRYRLFAYLHEMPLALAAADLAISRSGASVLGEYPAAGLPAILVPYTGGHRDQIQNATYLADRGAALLIPDETLDSSTLVSSVQMLLHDEARLAAMRQAARSLARPDAATRLASELMALVGDGG